ncbi:SurA N-terminal domain-containing protein [Virgibacillus chiguensis]|uniref:SurA N-terminal domain-containing protein n=1 Tax=Virgibacillus chiguensis TaxID=411959 RepID=A0A1M5QF02_9BACI|nr:SurA N-terminal domain-containing protein [Virgibacillus chiguensis]SHH12436.1 SurA N-terminal domain-containing protein [Virgibacillus chiguensis]
MKKWIIFAITITLVFLLAACGGDNEEDKTAEQDEQQEEGNTEEGGEKPEPVKITDKEKVDDGETVVSVNGEEIKGDRYNPAYLQLKTMNTQFNQDVNEDQLKKQTLDMLINQQLINQDAADKGIEVSNDDVQKEFDTIKKEGEDRLSTALEQFQLNEDQFKNMLRDNLITSQYLDAEFDIKVTDKEVEDYYKQMKEQNEEIGKLEDVKDQIKQTLKDEKTNEQLQKRVDKLKEDADVETMI